MKTRIKIVLTGWGALLLTMGSVCAVDVPPILPQPDGQPGDMTKPVQVYILAGQSNMVGFGYLTGARPPYDAIYLTADPAAAMGPLRVYRAGNYKIAPLKIDNPTCKQVGKAGIVYGVTHAQLPAPSGGQTIDINCMISVPENGDYTIHPGYGDSAYNVATLDGEEVYRKDIGGEAVTKAVTLEAGKRYALDVSYFKGGSAALWLRQENLLGKGSLDVVTQRDRMFPWMIDKDGQWTVRNDVYYQEVRIAADGRGCPLSATSNGKFIGPEVPFGFVMGAYHDEQVLLIESSMGNRALNFDFRPPSSGKTEEEKANKYCGVEYDAMVEGVHKTLNNIDKVVPGYAGQGYEIAGFVWWQGHKDAGQTKQQYEDHLVNLINDLRKEFNAPAMKAAIATVGFDGHNINEQYTEIHKAQMAVGDPQQHPEFAGQVKSVDTRGFWRPADESPTGTGYHYNHNAETYMLVGDALGRAMVDLMGGEAEPLPYGNRPKSIAETSAEELTEAQKAASQKALTPIILDGMAQAYVEKNRAAIDAEANSTKPARENQFLRGAMYGLNNLYHTAGVNDYDWHNFGPDLADVPWDYYSFDPPEKMEKANPSRRFREVTLPEGMENWFAADFNARGADWKSGLPPFGQKGGELAALRGCQGSPCGCGVTPRTLWENEVILIRKTIDIPPLRDDCRYRIVIGGDNHVKSGEGYAIYLNGKLLTQSTSGVPNRQGGQPRGGHIYSDFLTELKSGKATIAVKGFLSYGVRGPAPQGHMTVWLEEQKLPPLVK